jgi:hypothetical protein
MANDDSTPRIYSFIHIPVKSHDGLARSIARHREHDRLWIVASAHGSAKIGWSGEGNGVGAQAADADQIAASTVEPESGGQASSTRSGTRRDEDARRAGIDA